MNKRPLLGALSAISLGLCSFTASADFYAGALVSYSNAEYHHSSTSSVTEAIHFFFKRKQAISLTIMLR